jgi:hypothetical protein
LLAVQFYDELCRVPVEVDHELTERDLPAEPRAIETRAAQTPPENVFSVDRLLAQAARTFSAFGSLALGPLTPAPLPIARRETGVLPNALRGEGWSALQSVFYSPSGTPALRMPSRRRSR